MLIKRFSIVLASLALTALAACGGGGSANVTPAPAGTATQVVVSGAITGFGSVFVNGVRFETSRATIAKNGQSVTQQSLRVGQIVHIKGSVNDATGQAVADSVRQDDDLEGPITSVNATDSTFVVLAHTVKVTADTSFDASISPASIAGLTAGLQVEVSGMPDATGNIVATRIEKRGAGATQLEAMGKVSALDTVNHKFKLGNLVVDYTTATLQDFPATGIAADQLVEVKGNALNAAGELVATRVELRNFEGEDHSARREVEGLVTRFMSATDFDVAGRPVTTTASTQYQNGVVADLVANAKVEAEGSINAAGVLVAVKIAFKRGNSAGVMGRVDSVTADADGISGKVTVLGVTITMDANTRVEDKSDAKVEMFRITNISSGDYVRVRGKETGPLALTAARLERRKASATTPSYVRGTVRNLATPNLTILGVSVVTTATTNFDEGNATSFFASADGKVASARGAAQNNTITATQVEFEDHDD
jgi:Domain of unknown function (DUF5666)